MPYSMFSISIQGLTLLITTRLFSSKVFEVLTAFTIIFTIFEITHFLKLFYYRQFHLKYYADQFWIESFLKINNFNQITEDYLYQ